MTTRVTIDVPENDTYQVEVEVQHVPTGPQDDGVRRLVVQPGGSTSFYIYGSIQVKSIREVSIR